MKKSLVTLTLLAVSATAFAQGKIQFSNDSLHLVYYDIPGIGGLPAYNQLPLMADLYVGTSSSSLSLLTSSTWSTVAPGKWNAVNTTVNGVSGGGVVFAIAQVRSSSDTPAPFLTPVDAGSSHSSPHYIAWQTGLSLAWATSLEFQFTLGSSPLSYPNMYSARGTWLPGSFDLSGVDGTPPGSRGAIPVNVLIPEPTSFALAGLGAAALLIFRRRTGCRGYVG